MTPEECSKYLNVSRETFDTLSAYVVLLKKWQARINLISSASTLDIWNRHILDSAQLAVHIPAHLSVRDMTIMDIGSGAGFPGLVLSILGAGEVILVESDQRKAVFLQTVIRELGLTAKVINQRIETLPCLKPDIITARAVAKLSKLMSLISLQMHDDLTCLFLKGASVEEELTNFQSYSNMIPYLYPSRSSSDGVIVKLTMPN